MALLTSPWVQWAIEALLHSAIALFIVDGLIAVWRLHDPRVRFRLRLAVLLLPPAVGPLAGWASPARGDFWFRQDWALLDSHRWFAVEIFGVSLGATVLVIVGLGTSLLVLVQEVLPVLRDLRGNRGPRGESRESPELTTVVAELADALRIDVPNVRVFRSPRPVLLASGGKTPTIMVSEQLLDDLSAAQMRAALGHEMAHIERRSNLTTTIIFFARLVSFFNPVALLVFRTMLQDDEQVCDDTTIALTGDREALAAALERFKPATSPPASRRSARRALEDHSHTLLLGDRIARLRDPLPEEPRPQNPVPLAVLTILGICFFVV